MKLFNSGNSPYARRTRIAARECGLEVEDIDLAPMPAEHPLLKYGPTAKVPALLADDGTFLCETLLITRYLNDRGNGALLPADASEANAVLEVEGIGAALMDSLFARSHENRREDDEKSPATIEKEAKRAQRCYDALAQKLSGHAPSMNLGTIAAIAALGYADWRHAEDGWRDGRDGLTAWYDAMMSTYPSVEQTKPIF